PFLPTVNVPNVKLSNPWATYPGGNPFPLVINKDSKFPLFGTYRTDPFDYKPTYMNQWNVSIQRQFGKDWLITANYAGNSTMKLIAGGWQLSPIVKIRSAQFFTVTTGVDSALTAQPNQVPNLVPGVDPYAADKTVDHWLNPAAFTAPPPGTYGTLARNSLKGPGMFQLDMALSRTFTIRE